MSAMRNAATGLLAADRMMEVEAHNVANSSTNGYKRMSSAFADIAYQDMRRLGEGEREIGIMQVGLGVSLSGVNSDFSQGAMTQTDTSPLNMAIQGHGFFIVTRPDGELSYTRDGQFVTDAQGMVVMNGSGYQLGQQPIIIPDPAATDITIKADGIVTVNLDGAIQEIGRVELVNFINSNGLKRIGQNLFEETEASGPAVFGFPGDAGMSLVRQGFLESSNSNPTLALLAVTEASHWHNYSLKAFESAAKAEERVAGVNA